MHMRKMPVNWMLMSVSIGYVLPRGYELMQEYVESNWQCLPLWHKRLHAFRHEMRFSSHLHCLICCHEEVNVLLAEVSCTCARARWHRIYRSRQWMVCFTYIVCRRDTIWICSLDCLAYLQYACYDLHVKLGYVPSARHKMSRALCKW